MPLLLMIGLVILESRDGEASFSSVEYKKYMDCGNKQDDMNIKKLFNSSRKKKTYDGYTVENVMEYLRQEGLCPETDANDAKVVRFKYQRKSMNIAIIDNFCRVSSLWRATREETNIEAMYAAVTKVMDDYRYIRVIYSGDILEFAVDHIITSLDHFKEVFNLSLDLISEAEQIHQREYNNLVGSDDTDESSRRNDIYHPEFRWMPDVLFKEVADSQLAHRLLRMRIGYARIFKKAFHQMLRPKSGTHSGLTEWITTVIINLSFISFPSRRLSPRRSMELC